MDRTFESYLLPTIEQRDCPCIVSPSPRIAPTRRKVRTLTSVWEHAQLTGEALWGMGRLEKDFLDKELAVCTLYPRCFMYP